MSIREQLDRWGLHPSRSLGQNFLIDEAILGKIVAAANLDSGDVVLEIGAGLGAMTRLLAEQAGHVVAIEIDRQLLPALRHETKPFDNVTIVEGDILEMEPGHMLEWRFPEQTLNRSYKVVANLPYYITSAILRHLLEKARLRPETIVITVQREVAERIVAEPGDMSVLAVSVQLYGDPKLLFHIHPGSFYPSPAVDSAVLRIEVEPTPHLTQISEHEFFEVVRGGFAQRRKQLHNSLAASLSLDGAWIKERLTEVGVEPRRRAQTLSVDEWISVATALQPQLDRPGVED
jgi:16S rRNA (adenine1518-N6/adenine1519-N6)-dimethyltransferase